MSVGLAAPTAATGGAGSTGARVVQRRHWDGCDGLRRVGADSVGVRNLIGADVVDHVIAYAQAPLEADRCVAGVRGARKATVDVA